MFSKKSIATLVIFGLFSFTSLVYFYIAQRTFTQNQREFLIHLNNLDNINSSLTSELLKNSLFAYNSQDKIATDYDAMQREYKLLKNSKILQNKAYAKIKEDIEKNLHPQIQQFLLQVQDFLLLNASVKNSIVFLSRHTENGQRLKKTDQKLYIQAIKILDAFRDTKRMQDLDYLRSIHYLLKDTSKDKKTHLFVKTFNLHTSYLMKKLPHFIEVTKSVIENCIGDTLDKERKEFNEIVLHDFNFFNIFAFIVMAIFILYLLLVIYLFIKYYKVHTEFVKTSNSLQYSLSHDHLTGLYNRNSFEKDKKEMQKAPVILLLNIDSFKEINDVYGNNFGNKVLVSLADLLRHYMKNIDATKIYRVGGDEFALVFSGKTLTEVLQIAKELELFIRYQNFQVDDISLNLSVSIAVNNIAPLLENADLALKVVKKDMNRRVIVYEENLSVRKKWKKNIETIALVKSALNEDRIVPYFQPIVNLQTLKIEKYEALVRLILPTGEVLAPYAFLEVAAQTHYYYDITKTMITKTLTAAKRYPQYRFSINFSMKDIINQDIYTTLFTLFDTDAEIASRIDIELLETELVQVDDYRIGDFITRVHSYGCKVLIDDFGTGYSNFAYLANLNIDIIKIDASITKEIITDRRKLHILKSIQNFTHGMGMLNVAEFVETKEIALLLQEIGVEYGQGYLFSKPLPQPLESDDLSDILL